MKYMVITLFIAGIACSTVVREDDDDSDGGAGANHSSSTGEVPEIETCEEACRLVCPPDQGSCARVPICADVDDSYYKSIGCYEEARALWECGFRDLYCDPDSPDCCTLSCTEDAIGVAFNNCLHNAGGVTGASVSASASSGGM